MKQNITTRLIYSFFLLAMLTACGTANDPLPEQVTTQPTMAMTESTMVAQAPSVALTPPQQATQTAEPTATISPWSTEPNILQIEVMRDRSYPESSIVLEQTLTARANYDRYVVSYHSDGYKIYALMTVPNGEIPESGWPVILFNHGYIEPSIYRTTERYVDYVDQIARNGYIVFKSDYRAHGDSEGEEVIGGGYGTPGYTNDILNAISALKTREDVDPERIGMWGHSMGGQITLRSMVVSPDIKAGVIWGGVVVSYPEIIDRWDFTRNTNLSTTMTANSGSSTGSWLRSFSDWVKDFTTQYGEPVENPLFWNTISPNNYLTDLSGPIQLHHSTTDEMVPLAWSEALAGELNIAGLPYEFYIYPDDNHNISGNFNTAMQRTIEFFDTHVKGQ